MSTKENDNDPDDTPGGDEQGGGEDKGYSNEESVLDRNPFPNGDKVTKKTWDLSSVNTNTPIQIDDEWLSAKPYPGKHLNLKYPCITVFNKTGDLVCKSGFFYRIMKCTLGNVTAELNSTAFFVDCTISSVAGSAGGAWPLTKAARLTFTDCKISAVNGAQYYFMMFEGKTDISSFANNQFCEAHFHMTTSWSAGSNTSNCQNCKLYVSSNSWNGGSNFENHNNVDITNFGTTINGGDSNITGVTDCSYHHLGNNTTGGGGEAGPYSWAGGNASTEQNTDVDSSVPQGGVAEDGGLTANSNITGGISGCVFSAVGTTFKASSSGNFTDVSDSRIVSLNSKINSSSGGNYKVDNCHIGLTNTTHTGDGSPHITATNSNLSLHTSEFKGSVGGAMLDISGGSFVHSVGNTINNGEGMAMSMDKSMMIGVNNTIKSEKHALNVTNSTIQESQSTLNSSSGNTMELTNTRVKLNSNTMNASNTAINAINNSMLYDYGSTLNGTTEVNLNGSLGKMESTQLTGSKTMTATNSTTSINNVPSVDHLTTEKCSVAFQNSVIKNLIHNNSEGYMTSVTSQNVSTNNSMLHMEMNTAQSISGIASRVSMNNSTAMGIKCQGGQLNLAKVTGVLSTDMKNVSSKIESCSLGNLNAQSSALHLHNTSAGTIGSNGSKITMAQSNATVNSDTDSTIHASNCGGSINTPVENTSLLGNGHLMAGGNHSQLTNFQHYANTAQDALHKAQNISHAAQQAIAHSAADIDHNATNSISHSADSISHSATGDMVHTAGNIAHTADSITHTASNIMHNASNGMMHKANNIMNLSDTTITSKCPNIMDIVKGVNIPSIPVIPSLDAINNNLTTLNSTVASIEKSLVANAIATIAASLTYKGIDAGPLNDIIGAAQGIIGAVQTVTSLTNQFTTFAMNFGRTQISFVTGIVGNIIGTGLSILSSALSIIGTAKSIVKYGIGIINKLKKMVLNPGPIIEAAAVNAADNAGY